MDRNGNFGLAILISSLVALRKESVDRNERNATFYAVNSQVALRKESVDRNADASKISKLVFASLSARRAWIEI